MNFNINSRMIYLVLTGSHAYGFAKPESDIDLKGIAIPTKEYFYGFLDNFQQFEGVLKDFDINNVSIFSTIETLAKRPIKENEKLDTVIYDINKFLKLACDCNPNIIEVLYTDPEHRIIETKFSNILIENRNLFLSAKAKFTFAGYAFAQLKRIKSHRNFLLNPPTHKPTRIEFGLPNRTIMAHDELMAVESIINRKVDEWKELPGMDDMDPELLDSIRNHTIKMIKELSIGLADYVGDKGVIDTLIDDMDTFNEFSLKNTAGSYLGLSKNFLAMLDSERRYRSAKKNWEQYNEWKLNRNPVRAAMEAKFGYDGKHASHLVRLLRMAKEILLTGKVNVKREDGEELYSLREGAWSFDKLIEWSEKQQNELDEIYKNKSYVIPHKPDVIKINELGMELITQALSLDNLQGN